MKNRNIIFWTFLVILLLGGCQRQHDIEHVTQGITTITAGISADTKANIEGSVITWKETDTLYVVEYKDTVVNGHNMLTYSAVHPFPIVEGSISADGKNAEFNGNLTLKSDVVYEAMTAGSKIILAPDNNLVIPFEMAPQTQSGSSDHFEDWWYMDSGLFYGTASGSLSISLRNNQSVLSLELKLKDSISGSVPISRVTFSSPANGSFVYPWNGSYSAENSVSLEIGGSDTTISSQKSYIANIPMIWASHVTELTGDFEITIETPDGLVSTVKHPARALTNGKQYTAKLEFETFAYSTQKIERDALMALYNATDGPNWTNTTNWGGDQPVGEWYGIVTNSAGEVSGITLQSNNLNGTIPAEIGNLSNLEYLQISSNKLSGAIPAEVGNLSNLEYLLISSNKLSGAIPAEIGNLSKLTTLELYGNELTGSIPSSIGNLNDLRQIQLFNNQLSGTIPSQMGSLANLERIDLGYNQLSGSIPSEFAEFPNINYIRLSYNNFTGEIPASYSKDQSKWNAFAWSVIKQNEGYGFNSYPAVYLEPSNITTVDGTAIFTPDYFKQNKLTCVVLWRTWCGWSTVYLAELKSLYHNYASKGFNVLSTSDEGDLSLIGSYVTNNNIPGQVYQTIRYGANSNYITHFLPSGSPTFAFVDSTGMIVYSDSFTLTPTGKTREIATREFVESYLGQPEPPVKYESTDYSKDGEVVLLQRADAAKGIPLVLVGDGFVDRDMDAGGLYEQRMREGMEHFFSEEPYKSFRNRFTVYAVKAVSQNDGVQDGNSTIFETYFGASTLVGGNNTKINQYALKVPEITTLENLTVLNIVNSTRYAGTCYLSYPLNNTVSYCPIISNDDEQFRRVLVHEAGGHGFAKLADEYEYGAAISSEEVTRYKVQFEWGWYENVDFTSDRSTIKWANFLEDNRYNGLVDVFEGGLTYSYGVWKPTQESMMNSNTLGFNAPSRLAIYKRIMEQSGETYAYEKFLEYDAINRTEAAVAILKAKAAGSDKRTFVPFAPPVIITDTPRVNK